MIVEARIKWVDTQDEQEVLFKVGGLNEDEDDNIFYYVDSKENLVALTKSGVEDFVITEFLN